MSHPQSLTGKQMPDIMHFQLQKMQIKKKKKKGLLAFQQQIVVLRGSAGLQSCCCWSRGCAVSNGCDISQQLLLTPLHCCRWGVWLTRHIVSAPVCTQWTLTLHTLAINTRKCITPLPPPPHHPTHADAPYSDSRHTQTFCTTTSTSRSFRPLLTHRELRLIVFTQGAINYAFSLCVSVM